MLSNSAIESMGFQPIREGEAVEVKFHSLHVFSVRGFDLKEGDAVSTGASVAGTDCTVAVGGSVNQISNSICGDDYVEDEADWEKEHKCTPPYAVIHIGPTSSHTATHGYVKVDGNKMLTYDCFAVAKDDLRELEAKALPSIEMALACAFSTQPNTVRFIFVDRTVFGITPVSQVFCDIVVTSTGVGYAPNRLTAEEVSSGIQQIERLANLVDPRVSQFFQLGLRDKDSLKRFLYYFLAIEIDVHSCFRRSAIDQHVANGLVFDSRVSSSLSKLIANRDNWTGLADRFIWCVVSAWKHLCDDDIAEFKRLKKIRDDIAHGNISTAAEIDVVAVEKLALKIHNPPNSGP